MYDKIVYTLPRDCDSWNPVPRHQQGEVEIWRNGRGPKKLFVPPGETGPSTGASPAPNPRAARRAGCGARPGAVPRKVPAAAPRKLPAAGPSNKRDKYSRSPERRRTIKNPNRRAGGKRSPSHRNGGRSGGHKKRTGRRKDDETGCEEWSGEESSDYGDDSERSSEGTEVESQNECSENQQAGKESLGESWGVADNRVLGDSEESFKSLHSSDYSEMDLGSEDAGERRDSEELVYSDMEEWDGPSAVGQEPVDGFDKNTRKRERVDRRQQRRKQFMQQPGFRLEGGAAPGGDGGDDPGRGGRDNGSGRGDGSGRRDDDEDEKKKEADKKKAEEKKKKEAEEKKKKEAEEKKKKEAKDKEKREAEDKKEKEAQEEEKKAEPNKDMAEEKETEDKAEEKGSEDEAEEKKSEDKAEEKNEEDEDTEVGSQTDLAENNQSVKESLEDADKPEADTTGKKKDKRTSVSPSGPLKRRHNNDKDGKDDGDDAKPLPPKRARY
ncbi:hypothetical protein KR074_002416 [Drosophila pseudoananassae]|nr:hypothetical protein KR074_002416 [Drosophila pseudoananassae]